MPTIRQLAAPTVLCITPPAMALKAREPDVPVIYCDDVGGLNISAFSRNAIGCRKPSIDTTAEQVARISGWYGHKNCSVGGTAVAGERLFAPERVKARCPLKPASLW
jgi:hypothetical protein